MEPQLAPQGLWMAPTVCVLEPPHFMPGAVRFHPQSSHQTHILTQSAQGGFLHPHLIAAPPQNILTIPHHFHPSAMDGAKPTIHLPGHVTPLMARRRNIATEVPVSITMGQPLIPIQDASLLQNATTTTTFSKVVKRKRISPSAKRRSRLRLIAFLESKRKQQEDNEENATDSSDAKTGSETSECDLLLSPSDSIEENNTTINESNITNSNNIKLK